MIRRDFSNLKQRLGHRPQFVVVGKEKPIRVDVGTLTSEHADAVSASMQASWITSFAAAIAEPGGGGWQ